MAYVGIQGVPIFFLAINSTPTYQPKKTPINLPLYVEILSPYQPPLHHWVRSMPVRNLSLHVYPRSLFCLWPDISVKDVTLGSPVLPTCLWRVSWSEERGWSLWEFCLPPTLCFTATCTSLRTKSGKACWVCQSFSFCPCFCVFCPLCTTLFVFCLPYLFLPRPSLQVSLNVPTSLLLC